jgi:hypothetical protein
MSEASTDGLTLIARTRTGTSFPVGTCEEGNCESLVSAVFQHCGNEQRLPFKHPVSPANGEVIAERTG